MDPNFEKKKEKKDKFSSPDAKILKKVKRLFKKLRDKNVLNDFDELELTK